jgi:HAD superfamily hydrolase (TIGR01459 family)
MSFRLLRGLGEIIGAYDGVILDLWGVVHDGNNPYPGVLDALGRLDDAAKPVVLLSNAPRRSDAIAARLTEIGIPAKLYRGVYSSGEEAWQRMKWRDTPFYAALGKRCCFVGPTRDEGMTEGLDVVRVEAPGEADFLLNTGPWGWDETTEKYEPILAAARARDLPMVCANADLSVIHRGRRIICAGTLAQRYEELGGRVSWHGKPYPSVYEASLAMLGIANRRRVLAVGDSLRTDIAGARAAGIDAVWIVGGLHAEELGVRPGELPDEKRVAAALATAGEAPLGVASGFAW